MLEKRLNVGDIIETKSNGSFCINRISVNLVGDNYFDYFTEITICIPNKNGIGVTEHIYELEILLIIINSNSDLASFANKRLKV